MITVDNGSAVPVYDQIREQVQAHIAAGNLATGTRLPSIRQLAGDLRIAPGTVARAYSELESAGLIASSRAGGTRVVGERRMDDDLLYVAAELTRLTRRRSLELEDALAAVRAAWTAEAGVQVQSP